MINNLKKYALTAVCSAAIGISGCNSERIEQRRYSQELVNLIRQNGGELKGYVITTEVANSRESKECEDNHRSLIKAVKSIYLTESEREKSDSNLPVPIYTFNWAKKMEGKLQGEIPIRLETVHVKTDHNYILNVVPTSNGNTFNCGGYYAYAWEDKMQGNVGGNIFELKATPDGVVKVKEDKGYAWTANMQGKLGDKIDVYFHTTKVSKEGEGYPEEAVLTFKIKEDKIAEGK